MCKKKGTILQENLIFWVLGGVFSVLGIISYLLVLYTFFTVYCGKQRIFIPIKYLNVKQLAFIFFPIL